MLGERSKVFERVTCGLSCRLVVTMGAFISLPVGTWETNVPFTGLSLSRVLVETGFVLMYILFIFDLPLCLPGSLCMWIERPLKG